MAVIRLLRECSERANGASAARMVQLVAHTCNTCAHQQKGRISTVCVYWFSKVFAFEIWCAFGNARHRFNRSCTQPQGCEFESCSSRFSEHSRSRGYSLTR